MRSCLGNLCGCVSISESSVGIEEQFAVFNRELDPGVHCSPWCLGRRVKARLFLGERAEELTTGIRTQDDVPCCVHAVINYQVPREKAKLLYKKREDFRDFLNTKFCDAVEQLNHTWSSINSGKAAINNDLTKKMQQAAKDYGLEVSHISWKFRREFNSVIRPEEEKCCYGADVSNTGIRRHLNMLLEKPSSHNDLLIAISHKDIGKVRGLLEDGVDANVAPNGLTPLLVSILISEFECTCLLLQHGADANGSALEVYPLGVAAIEGNNKVIQLLVDHQADPNVPTYYGLLPIELSALQGNHEGMSILFPLTKQMDDIRNWSHVGILDYVGSRSAKDKREKKLAECIISSEAAARRAELRADYLTALYWHTEVLRVYPLRVEALFRRAFCWENLAETQKALCDVNSCLEIDPQSAAFLQRKAELLLVAKEFVTAQSSFLSAIQADPTNMKRMKEFEEFTVKLGEAVRSQALTARG